MKRLLHVPVRKKLGIVAIVLIILITAGLSSAGTLNMTELLTIVVAELVVLVPTILVWMHATPQIITSAMQLYFSGASLRKTADSLRLIGADVSYKTIEKWIAKYVSLMSGYVEKIQPRVSDAWRADEIFVKFSGKMEYVFALMDDETRFWIAQQVAAQKGTSDVKPMFYEGARLAGKNPKTLITDGAQNYIDGARAFSTHGHRINHIREIRLTGQIHNNKMERMNGEIRDREKVMRGLKNENTAILTGMQIFHNFVRPHIALGGKTPAEAAGITIQGEDKWKTLIQNASKRV